MLTQRSFSSHYLSFRQITRSALVLSVTFFGAILPQMAKGQEIDYRLRQFSRRLELLSLSILHQFHSGGGQQLSPLGTIFLQGEAPEEKTVRTLETELLSIRNHQKQMFDSTEYTLSLIGPDRFGGEPNLESTAISDYLRAAHNLLILHSRQKRWGLSVQDLIEEAKQKRNFERRLNEIGFDANGNLRMGPRDHRDQLPVPSDVIFRKINQFLVNASEPFRNLTQVSDPNWRYPPLETILESKVISRREKERLAEALFYYLKEFVNWYNTIIAELLSEDFDFGPQALDRHLNWHQITPYLEKVAEFSNFFGVNDQSFCYKKILPNSD